MRRCPSVLALTFCLLSDSHGRVRRDSSTCMLDLFQDVDEGSRNVYLTRSAVLFHSEEAEEGLVIRGTQVSLETVL
jgi:hypothetical protein